jgi:hypothetical protein
VSDGALFEYCNLIQMLYGGAQKLMGENLKVALAEFSTLSLAVLLLSVTAWQRQACPHLELKANGLNCDTRHMQWMSLC